MAARPVNLCADLQAWHSAGLSFLYFPDLDARELLRSAALQAAGRHTMPEQPRAAPGPLRAAAVAEQARPVAGGQARGAESTRASAGAGQGQGAADRPAGGPDLAGQPQKTAMNVADNTGSVPDNTPLPKAWEAVLTKVKPAPVIWTYLELGEDLMVKGDPARRAALKELIGGLGLKGGTSAFLPAVLPGCPADGSESWCFQSLLGRLGGRILVSFGPEALALGPYAALGLEPFQEKIVQGRMILCLPSFSEILANPARFEGTKVFLRAAFAKINIL